MKKTISIVEKGWEKFKSSCDEAAILLEDKVDFDFSIGYQPSDGPVMEVGLRVAPLDACIKYINKHSLLTWEAFLSLCI